MVVMETKSRFEVLKELNDKKEVLMRERNKLDTDTIAWEKEQKRLNKELTDFEVQYETFNQLLPTQRKNIDSLIKSVEESIESLQRVNANK